MVECWVWGCIGGMVRYKVGGVSMVRWLRVLGIYTLSYKNVFTGVGERNSRKQSWKFWKMLKKLMKQDSRGGRRKWDKRHKWRVWSQIGERKLLRLQKRNWRWVWVKIKSWEGIVCWGNEHLLVRILSQKEKAGSFSEAREWWIVDNTCWVKWKGGPGQV